MLQKLRFLFQLPARLQKCLEIGSYSDAVSCYVRTKSILHRYQEVESFSGINNDCKAIIKKIIEKLNDSFLNKVWLIWLQPFFLNRFLYITLKLNWKYNVTKVYTLQN